MFAASSILWILSYLLDEAQTGSLNFSIYVNFWFGTPYKLDPHLFLLGGLFTKSVLYYNKGGATVYNLVGTAGCDKCVMSVYIFRD